MGFFRCTCGAFGDEDKCIVCGDPLDQSGTPQDVDGAGLLRAISESPVPILVDFWAEWCGPCKTASPIVEQVAKGMKGHLVVLKFDIDTDKALATRVQIQSIPTFVLFAGGAELARHSGVMPPAELRRWMTKAALAV